MIIGRWGSVGTALLGAAVGWACTAALSAGPGASSHCSPVDIFSPLHPVTEC